MLGTRLSHTFIFWLFCVCVWHFSASSSFPFWCFKKKNYMNRKKFYLMDEMNRITWNIYWTKNYYETLEKKIVFRYAQTWWARNVQTISPTRPMNIHVFQKNICINRFNKRNDILCPEFRIILCLSFCSLFKVLPCPIHGPRSNFGFFFTLYIVHLHISHFFFFCFHSNNRFLIFIHSIFFFISQPRIIGLGFDNVFQQKQQRFFIFRWFDFVMRLSYLLFAHCSWLSHFFN